MSRIRRTNLTALLAAVALLAPTALAAGAAASSAPQTRPTSRAAVPSALAAAMPTILAARELPASLSAGARGLAVLALQALLREVGHDPGPLDGLFGPHTAAAVAAFQASAGLPATGRVDRPTAVALLRRASVLKPGDRGVAVLALQILLRAHGDARVPVDGVFGPSTLAAVQALEAALHLPVAKTTSPDLWLRLLGARPPATRTASRSSEAPIETVLGYYTEWPGSGSWTSFVSHLDDLTAIAPLWFTIRASGQVVARSAASDIEAVTTYAHAHGKKVLALVTNGGGNDVILTAPAVRWAAVQNLVATVQRYGLDGVNIDFELIDGTDQAGLTRFVAMTAARLRPLGLVTTVAVGPRARDGLPLSDPSDAYDYAALGRVADAVVLMTYDEHDDGGAPGPVAGIAWVRRVLAYALTKIPASKILLGLADYGYDWAGPGQAVSLQSGQAEALAESLGVPVAWDAAAAEPYFSYVGQDGQRHMVWFEDGQSIAAKLALVTADHLGGVAIWSLGHEDPAFFPTIGRFLHLTP